MLGVSRRLYSLPSFPSFFPTRAHLRFHPTVRLVSVTVLARNRIHTQSPLPLTPQPLPSTNSSAHRITMDSEPDHSDSPSVIHGGGAVSEDFVHVDDAASGVDGSLFGDASMIGSEWRGEGSDDFLSKSGIGSDGAGFAEGVHGGEPAAGGGGEDNDGRRELPEELLMRIVKLTCESTAAEGGICDVYLVGTAHVSTDSCEEVQKVISLLKPEAVFLELCSSRVTILQPQNLKVPTAGEMVEMWKKNHNLFAILYGWFLAKVATQLEVLPGAEFRVAFEEAMKYGGKVILGDRPVQITLRRTWAKMPIWHKTKLVASLLFQAVSLPSAEDLTKMLKEMDDVDMLTLVIQEMSKTFPTLMETLVHERDRYMSSTLLRVASENRSVVAVVGKGHLPGIKKYWKQPVEVKELMVIPTHKPMFSIGKVLATFGVTVAGVAIVSGIYLSVKK